MVIVCAQPKGYAGTSITNAAERVCASIAASLKIPVQLLWDNLKDYWRSKFLSEKLGDLKTSFEGHKTKGITVLAGLIRAAEEKEKHGYSKRAIKNAIWLQSYPSKDEPFPQVNFWVNFDRQTNEAVFTPVSLNRFADETGYSLEDLSLRSVFY